MCNQWYLNSSLSMMKYVFFKIQTQHLQNVEKPKKPIYKKKNI